MSKTPTEIINEEMEREAEEINDQVVPDENDKDEKDPLDELMDLLVPVVLGDKDLTTIMELRFYGNEEGLRVEAGGSVIAAKSFCKLGPEYETLYNDMKAKFKEVSAWINDRMCELGCVGIKTVDE